MRQLEVRVHFNNNPTKDPETVPYQVGCMAGALKTKLFYETVNPSKKIFPDDGGTEVRIWTNEKVKQVLKQKLKQILHQKKKSENGRKVLKYRFKY